MGASQRVEAGASYQTTKHYEAYIAPDPVVEAEEPTGGHSSFSKGNPMDWNDENNYEGTGRSKYMELSLRGGVPFPNAMR